LLPPIFFFLDLSDSTFHRSVPHAVFLFFIPHLLVEPQNFHGPFPEFILREVCGVPLPRLTFFLRDPLAFRFGVPLQVKFQCRFSPRLRLLVYLSFFQPLFPLQLSLEELDPSVLIPFQCQLPILGYGPSRSAPAPPDASKDVL